MIVFFPAISENTFSRWTHVEGRDSGGLQQYAA
ncbi:hypothetical protein W822_00705 [Advenella kashmirensis W13003]|uniref:Uncharacterized protein n=1 Tax=Advenella kashmirensis W13003 TaxID=1424334 RepID=V8R042_9BURK|nr:hypothetical protein W822_00705 [Advenella kashmirensis W13003]